MIEAVETDKKHLQVWPVKKDSNGQIGNKYTTNIIKHDAQKIFSKI